MAVITLDDLFDRPLLDTMTADGYVRVQRHPTLPFVIHNYTEKSQFEGVWNPVTLACRGLITHAVTGEVLARPYRKFFNHGQDEAGAFDLAAPVTVTDKMDGSLGVLYSTPDGWAVATRGSFASDQAAHATAVLNGRYGAFTPPPGLTLLYEIVYPANRIVVDYGDLDDLVLLGGVEIATGRSVPAAAVEGWPGPVVEALGYATLAEALAAPPRTGREGLVVHFPDTDHRIKIKYAEYVALHRIVTGLNARVVWEALVTDDVPALVERLPDEFHDWVKSVETALTAAVAARAVEVEAAFAEIVAGLPGAGNGGFTRKEFALVASRHPDRGKLFLRLDDRDYRPLLWQEVRPAPDWSPHGRTFDAD